MLDVARNAAGVSYVTAECINSGTACVDRRDMMSHTTQYLPGDYAAAARSVVDATGHVHMLWTHVTFGVGNSPYTLALEYATDASGTLVSTPIAGETTTGGLTDVFDPNIALDPNGLVQIAFTHVGGTEVHHGVWTGTSFAIDTIPAIGTIAFAIDHAGVPTLVTTNGSALLWRLTNGTWSSQRLPNVGGAGTPWLGFDAANKPHVLFDDGTSNSRQLRLAWLP